MVVHIRIYITLSTVMSLTACGAAAGHAEKDAMASTELEVATPETETETPALACMHDTAVFDPDFEFERYDLRSGDVSGVTHEPDTKHIVILPGHREPKAELFVWLPGSGAKPSGYEWILKAAAFAGYRTIGLAYVNDVEVKNRCSESSDPNCSFHLRMENQTGSDVSEFIEVRPTDCIDARLAALLDRADTQRPGSGWAEYLSDGAPDWTRIVVAGHSQGGGQAAFISHQHSVARAVHFSNAGDGTGGGNAPWALEPRQTPADRLFVLFHEEESAANRIPAIADAIGMSDHGAPVGIDAEAPPYDCTHLLFTDIPVDSPIHGHRTVASDSALVLDDNGLPLHLPAWIYLFTASRNP